MKDLGANYPKKHPQHPKSHLHVAYNTLQNNSHEFSRVGTIGVGSCSSAVIYMRRKKNGSFASLA